MQLLQGATVYAGDRIGVVMGLTAKDPATGQQVPVPAPSDAIVRWYEGDMAPGSNLVFEHNGRALDEVRDLGGPLKVVALIDKVDQTKAGYVTVRAEIRDPKNPATYWISPSIRFSTAPGERPMSQPNPNPNPQPTSLLPQNATLTATLLQPQALMQPTPRP